MAKKFVRGITDIKTIEHQDFDTNNVNDLLSDGKHNYIHRKKQDGSEEYHNLTNNIKTIQSDDTDLLTVTNYNNTTNSATIRPKHDTQKEQVLESTDNTIVITHGENGTEETTSVDVNPAKVLEHDNLQTSYGISKLKSGNISKLSIDYAKVADGFDLNDFENGLIRVLNPLNAPQQSGRFFVSAFTEGVYTYQTAIKISQEANDTYIRLKTSTGWGEWREQVGDKSAIDTLLAKKEQLLESTDETILIEHGENGTDETTSVDVNPVKVLEHDNLVSNSDYVTISHEENSNISEIKTDVLDSEISTLKEKTTLIGGRNLWIQSKATGDFTEELLPENHITGQKKCFSITNNQKIEFNLEPDFSPRLYRKVTFSAWIKYENVVKGSNPWNKFNVFKHNLYRKNSSTSQESSAESIVLDELVGTSEWKYVSYTYDYGANTSYDQLKTTLRFVLENVVSGKAWVTGIKVELGLVPTDYTQPDEDVEYLLAQKQNTLTSNTSIGLVGTGLMQLYCHKKSYSKPLEGSLNTYAKTVKKATQLTADPKLEYHFTALLKDNIAGMSVDLEDDDVSYFTSILTKYGRTSGSGKDAMINGLLFTLNGSRLTISRNDPTYNQVVSFCDIIEPSQSVE